METFETVGHVLPSTIHCALAAMILDGEMKKCKAIRGVLMNLAKVTKDA